MAVTGICEQCWTLAGTAVPNRETRGITPLGLGACVNCGQNVLVFAIPAGTAESTFPASNV